MGKAETDYINMIEKANLNLRKKVLLKGYFIGQGLSPNDVVDKLALLDRRYVTFEV